MNPILVYEYTCKNIYDIKIKFLRLSLFCVFVAWAIRTETVAVGLGMKATRSGSTARVTNGRTRRWSSRRYCPRLPTGQRRMPVALYQEQQPPTTRPWRRLPWSSAAWRHRQRHHAPRHQRSCILSHRPILHRRRRRPSRGAQPLPSLLLPTPRHPSRTACRAAIRRRCRVLVRRCLPRRRNSPLAPWRTHRQCPGETPLRKWVATNSVGIYLDSFM